LSFFQIKNPLFKGILRFRTQKVRKTGQELRQYDRRIYDLNKEIVRKLNKLDAVLQRCNIRLSNYLTNVNGKSFKAVVNALCDGVTDPEELIKLVHGRSITAHGKDVILASLTGVISQAEKDILRQLRDEVNMAQGHKADCPKENARDM